VACAFLAAKRCISKRAVAININLPAALKGPVALSFSHARRRKGGGDVLLLNHHGAIAFRRER
jgi:hypothetical protein